MRGALAATAMVGALAAGGLPALALAGADRAATGTASSSPDAAADPQAPRAERGPATGPPPWARAHGLHDKAEKHAQKDAEKLVWKAEKAAARTAKADAKQADRQGRTGDGAGRAQGPKAVPPGWAKHPDKRARAGRAHPPGAAVRVWAHCLAEEARSLSGDQRLDAEKACGPHPLRPRR